jgi:hypothetical protein
MERWALKENSNNQPDEESNEPEEKEMQHRVLVHCGARKSAESNRGRALLRSFGLNDL